MTARSPQGRLVGRLLLGYSPGQSGQRRNENGDRLDKPPLGRRGQSQGREGTLAHVRHLPAMETGHIGPTNTRMATHEQYSVHISMVFDEAVDIAIVHPFRH